MYHIEALNLSLKSTQINRNKDFSAKVNYEGVEFVDFI